MKIRPHHLLCMLSFAGKGYSPEFVKQFNHLRKQFFAGEGAEIVSDEDELCAHCPFDQGEGFCASPNSRVSPEQIDERLKQILSLSDGMTVTKEELIVKLRQIPVGELLKVCEGCSWQEGGCPHKILGLMKLAAAEPTQPEANE